MHGASDVAHLTDRHPRVTPERLIAGLVPPPTFADVSFDTYRPDPSQSAEWNRGAYLVEGLAHCGACHTPRNALGAERNSAQFAGGDVDNWHAYALNDRSHAPVPWDTDALFAYLRQGWHADHGTARGPMAEVVSNLSAIPSSDVRAIAVYMAGVSGTPTPDRKRQGEAALEQARSSSIQGSQANAAGASLRRVCCFDPSSVATASRRASSRNGL